MALLTNVSKEDAAGGQITSSAFTPVAPLAFTSSDLVVGRRYLLCWSFLAESTADFEVKTVSQGVDVPISLGKYGAGGSCYQMFDVVDYDVAGDVGPVVRSPSGADVDWDTGTALAIELTGFGEGVDYWVSKSSDVDVHNTGVNVDQGQATGKQVPITTPAGGMKAVCFHRSQYDNIPLGQIFRARLGRAGSISDSILTAESMGRAEFLYSMWGGSDLDTPSAVETFQSLFRVNQANSGTRRLGAVTVILNGSLAQKIASQTTANAGSYSAGPGFTNVIQTQNRFFDVTPTEALVLTSQQATTTASGEKIQAKTEYTVDGGAEVDAPASQVATSMIEVGPALSAIDCLKVGRIGKIPVPSDATILVNVRSNWNGVGTAPSYADRSLILLNLDITPVGGSETGTYPASSGGFPAGANQPPTVTGPSGATTVETGQSVAVAGFSVADADGDSLTVTLGVSGGTLNLSSPLSGTAAAINSQLATLQFTAGAVGAGSITVTANDGAVNSSPVTQSITITAAGGGGNAVPVVTAPIGSLSVETGQSLTVGGWSVTDAEGDQVTITIAVTGGNVSVTSPQIGTPTQLTTLLSGMSFQATGAAGSTGSITITPSDASGTGTAVTKTVSITAAGGVNNPPTVNAPAGTSVAVNASVAIAASMADVDNPTASVTAQLTVTGGTLSADTTGGANATGNGTASVGLTGTLAQVNAALGALTFTAPAAIGTVTFTISATDDQGASSGSETAAINITPVGGGGGTPSGRVTGVFGLGFIS